MPKTKSIIIAQLTDTHILADPSGKMLDRCTRDSFDTIVTAIDNLEVKPDLLLLTGDLSQDETTESYQYLKNSLDPLAIPYDYIPGNHDNPAIMEQILPKTRQSFYLGNWHLILLNSRVSGHVEGKLSPETLVWLEMELSQNPTDPTLIAIHHHPVKINSQWMDQINLVNSEALRAILNHYPQVRLVLFGHIHQEFDSFDGKIRYLGTPSTCVQFKPNQQNLVIDSLTPGFRLITLYSDGSFETEVQRI
jgi:3',5'-cyclic-AMP phosphodiesterase